MTHPLVMDNCVKYPDQTLAKRSYGPGTDFRYVSTVTLTLEIWPWVMDINCVKYYPDRTSGFELWSGHDVNRQTVRMIPINSPSNLVCQGIIKSCINDAYQISKNSRQNLRRYRPDQIFYDRRTNDFKYLSFRESVETKVCSGWSCKIHGLVAHDRRTNTCIDFYNNAI